MHLLAMGVTRTDHLHSGIRAMQKKTSPSLDPTTCNCLALRQAARRVSQIYDGHLTSEGLRTTQYSILAKLDRLGPMSINELAKSMVMALGPRDPPVGARWAIDDRSGQRWPHTQPAADSQGRSAAQSCKGKMARGAEGIRNSLWRARCRRPADGLTTRCLH